MSEAGTSSSTLRRYARDEAPRDVVETARPHEQRVGRTFRSLTVFPRPALDELHLEPASGTVLPPRVRTARADAYEVRFCMATLTETANGLRPDEPRRGDHRRAIRRYAEGAGLNVAVNVGHVSGSLASDYSVVDPAAPDRLLLDHQLSRH